MWLIYVFEQQSSRYRSMVRVSAASGLRVILIPGLGMTDHQPAREVVCTDLTDTTSSLLSKNVHSGNRRGGTPRLSLPDRLGSIGLAGGAASGLAGGSASPKARSCSILQGKVVQHAPRQGRVTAPSKERAYSILPDEVLL